MSSVAKATGSGKPAKPRPDYPLFPHATRRWAKKIKGKLHYFGPWDDPDGALQRYLDTKDDLYAGRKPRLAGDGLTVKDLCNRFLSAKQDRVSTSEIQQRTWDELFTTCELILKAFGRSRRVDDLAADDFADLRRQFADGRGLEAIGNQVRRARQVFKFAWDMRLVERPVAMGPDFRPASRSAMRRAKAERPQRFFTAAEIRELLKVASIPVRAMLYLGINTGIGNTDVGELRMKHLDLERGILDFPRIKTGIERRAILWPETIKAIQAAIKARPAPKDAADADRVFLTRCGVPWVRYSDSGHIDSLAQEADKLLVARGIKRRGLGFYSLRHVFETVAGETGDQPGVDRVMGHEQNTMAARYREWRRDEREDERLRRIVEHVHRWLFGSARTPGKRSRKSV